MKSFFEQLKWHLILLQKNNILSISLILTLLYGTIFYFLKEVTNVDKALVFMVLNDPTIIGYFFITLSIYTEMKLQILPAIFTTPIKIHQYLIPKVLALSLLGLLCSLLLVFFVKGFDFDILNYSIAALTICILTSLLALIIMTYSTEFLKFAMMSVPVILVFMIVPLIQYVGLIDLGFAKYIFPIQSAVDLLDYSVSNTNTNLVLAYIQLIFWIVALYFTAFKFFSTKIIHR